MVIGESTRKNDLNLNVCREKHLSSVRTAGKDKILFFLLFKKEPLIGPLIRSRMNGLK